MKVQKRFGLLGREYVEKIWQRLWAAAAMICFVLMMGIMGAVEQGTLPLMTGGAMEGCILAAMLLCMRMGGAFAQGRGNRPRILPGCSGSPYSKRAA